MLGSDIEHIDEDESIWLWITQEQFVGVATDLYSLLQVLRMFTALQKKHVMASTCVVKGLL